jgi:hypothetical protein
MDLTSTSTKERIVEFPLNSNEKFVSMTCNDEHHSDFWRGESSLLRPNLNLTIGKLDLGQHFHACGESFRPSEDV